MRNKVTRVNQLEKEVLFSTKTEKVEMTLNTANAIASGLLIQRLTELYENPIEATVRETISNALDAVVESCSGSRPTVTITAPTSLHPVLVIKDNGVGMSYDDLKEIYSKYGSSTKTDNLNAIGAYGLGAKSPLAYGTEFTVTSVKNGQKTTLIVAREELTNYIKIVNSEQTDEASGTTVSIPVNSKDVAKFAVFIDFYKKVPMDKDVDLVINGEKVETQLVVVTEKLKIYESEQETVYGKVWINKKNALGALSLREYNIDSNISFVIGGWGYRTPSTRYYTRATDNLIYIELKPGIVGFNSSRDAILENERYDKLRELVVGYIYSDQFTEDVVKQINNMDIDDFKSVISELIYDYKRHIKLDENGISLKEIDLSDRTLKLESLVHSETGYNINKLLSNVPKVQKSTVAFMEKKSKGYKRSENGLVYNDLSYYGSFDKTSITDINKTIDSIMEGIEDSYNLNCLVINIASLLRKEVLNSLKITFVTDIKDNQELQQLKTGRKSLISIRNNNEYLHHYTSLLIYTKHNKKEMEKMMSNITVENLDIKIDSAENFIKQIKIYKSKNTNRAAARKRSTELSTRFYIQKESKKDIAYIENVDKKTKNFVIITKDYDVGLRKMSMILTWYCNEKDLEPGDVNMYISYGQHTATDLLILRKTFGEEIYRDSQSKEVGNSKLYFNEFHEKIAHQNALSNKLINTSEKALIRLLSGITGYSPKEIIMSLIQKAEQMQELTEFAGLAETTLNIEEMKDKLFKRLEVFNPPMNSNEALGWGLYNDALAHLANSVNEKHLQIAKNILLILKNSTFIIENGNFRSVYSQMGLEEISSYIIEDMETPGLYSKEYIKLIKENVKNQINFVKETLEQVMKI